jgi:hypothetical protein
LGLLEDALVAALRHDGKNARTRAATTLIEALQNLLSKEKRNPGGFRATIMRIAQRGPAIAFRGKVLAKLTAIKTKRSRRRYNFQDRFWLDGARDKMNEWLVRQGYPAVCTTKHIEQLGERRPSSVAASLVKILMPGVSGAAAGRRSREGRAPRKPV